MRTLYTVSLSSVVFLWVVEDEVPCFPLGESRDLGLRWPRRPYGKDRIENRKIVKEPSLWYLRTF